MNNFNQPVLSDYNPFIRGGKKSRHSKRTRRYKRKNTNRRTRRRYN